MGEVGDRRDSNPRQPESQSGALPTELRPPYTELFKQTISFETTSNASRAGQDSNLLPPA